MNDGAWTDKPFSWEQGTAKRRNSPVSPKMVAYRTVIIDERNGVLNLLSTKPVEAPVTEAKKVKRKFLSFVIPHIPHYDRSCPKNAGIVRNVTGPRHQL